MLWLFVFLALLIALIAWRFIRTWVKPWRDFEELLTTISRGEQPPTLILSGNRHVRRLGVALEALLSRQRQLDHELRQESARTRAVFAGFSDPVVVVDLENRIIFCNAAFEQRFGPGGRERFEGTHLLNWVRHAEVTRTVQATANNSQSQAVEVTGDNGGGDFELRTVPVLAPESKGLTGVLAIFHDVSRLKQAERARRDFVANVSHEFRTPLAVFRGNVEELLERQELSRAETRHIYSALKRHSDRLNLLVEDLLCLARLESPGLQLQLASVNVAALLRRVAHEWEARASAKNVTLQVETTNQLPPIEADEFRLEQLLYNLLQNAINYSHQGGKVMLRASSDNNQLVLAVSDQGVGIAPADLPRIFERFYRADRSRSRDVEGTGLGLSIVKHIAQLHGGDVRAKSKLGEGTTITVLLPARAVTQT